MSSAALREPLLKDAVALTRDLEAPPSHGNNLADALATYITAAAALHPPRSIRRGVSVSSALSKYGQIFMTNPDKLPYEQRWYSTRQVIWVPDVAGHMRASRRNSPRLVYRVSIAIQLH